MWPPVHPALGYLLYSCARRAADRGPPSGTATAAVLAGGALPDLVDQPLYRLLALPSTRTVGHSLLFVVPVAVAAVVGARRSSLPDAVGVAFAVGLLAHPFADALWPLLLGPASELGFLLWPVTHSPDYVGRKPLFVIAGTTVTTLWVELPLLAAALLVWWRDGTPGIGRADDRGARSR